MPSTSPAQHRWIGWLHSHPEERPASLSKGQVDEWLHADKGSPWKHKDAGGALSSIRHSPPPPNSWMGALKGSHRYDSDVDPGMVHQPPAPPMTQEQESDFYLREPELPGAGRVPSVRPRGYDAGGDIPPDYARFVLGDSGLAGIGAHMLGHSTFGRAQSKPFADSFKPVPGYPKARQMTPQDMGLSEYDAKGNAVEPPGYQYGGATDYMMGNAGLGMMQGNQPYGGANGIADAGAIGATGAMLPTPDPSGGQAPSIATQNPIAQQQYQRYAQLPVEKLQELAVQLPANSQQGQIVRRVLQLQRMRSSQQQGQQQGQSQSPTTGSGGDTQGIAGPQQPGSSAGIGYQSGGMLGVPLSEADPWWTRAAARQDMATGFLHGNTFGRADHLTTQAPGGAYVVPADVVSGLGEGNSMAGANVIQRMLETGPYGTPLPRGGRGHTIPRPPAPAGGGGGGYRGYGEGGYGGYAQAGVDMMATRGGHVGHEGIGKPVPVKFSHGEYVIKPEQVMRIARRHFGWRLPRDEAMKQAHELLDDWVVSKRKETARKMLKLPGPTK